MTPLKGLNDILYLVQLGETGNYELVNPQEAPEGQVLFSLEKTTIVDGVPEGYFYFVPKFIHASNVIPKKVKILSQITNGISGVSGASAVLFVDGQSITVTFPLPSNLTNVVDAINESVVNKLGQSYSNFASVSNSRILLETPQEKNTFVVIPDNSLWVFELGFKAGQYYGDLPAEIKSYVEDEAFILLQESITPNNGTPSGKFFPVKKENGILRYLSEFDRGLVQNNPRLELLFDGFANSLETINSEMNRFIDQIDLSKIDLPNLEYLAYLFGINLEDLLRESADNILNAREVLRSIMNIIQIKGTSKSFSSIFRFANLIAEVTELRPDDFTEIPDFISSDAIIDFYNRFLIKDSPWRNPVVNYGMEVPTVADLPTLTYEGEFVKVTADNQILQRIGNDWVPVSNTIKPVNGKGNLPDPAINELEWTFTESNRPYVKISTDVFNDIKVIGLNPPSILDHGLSIKVGNGVTHSGVDDLFNITVDTSISSSVTPTVYNAFIVTDKSEPYDLSSSDDKSFKLLIDETELLEFDITDFLNQVSDISSVSVDELKEILEKNYPSIAVSRVQLPPTILGGPTNIFGFSIASKTFGKKSSIRVIEGNDKLGFNVAEFVKVLKPANRIEITAGSANITNAPVEIPEVTFPGDFINITSIEDTTQLDGIYSFRLHKDNKIIITSNVPFYQSIFDQTKGYISEQFNSEDTVLLGSVVSRNGEYVSITQEKRQSDYSPTVENLTIEQKSAIRGFIRSKLNTAEDFRVDINNPSTYTEGKSLSILASPERGQTNGAFYDRNGNRNLSQTINPGVSNDIILLASPFNPNTFTLNEDIIRQIDKFIGYVRPAHIQLLNLLFAVPEFKDVWDKWQDVDGILKLGALERSSKQLRGDGEPLWETFLFPDWVSGTTYLKGSIVWHNSIMYVANTDTSGEPGVSSDWNPRSLPDHVIDIVDLLEKNMLFPDAWLTDGEGMVTGLPPNIGAQFGYRQNNGTFVQNPNNRPTRVNEKVLPAAFPLATDRNNKLLTDTVIGGVTLTNGVLVFDITPIHNNEFLVLKAGSNWASGDLTLQINDVFHSFSPVSPVGERLTLSNVVGEFKTGDIVSSNPNGYTATVDFFIPEENVIGLSSLSSSFLGETSLVTPPPPDSPTATADIFTVTATPDTVISISYPDLSALKTAIDNAFGADVVTTLFDSNTTLIIQDVSGDVFGSTQRLEPIMFVDNTDDGSGGSAFSEIRHEYNSLKPPMITDILNLVVGQINVETATIKTVGQDLLESGNRLTTDIPFKEYVSTFNKGLGNRSQDPNGKYNVDISLITPSYAAFKGGNNPALKESVKISDTSIDKKEISLGANYLKGSENQISLNATETALSTEVFVNEIGAAYSGSNKFGTSGVVIPKNHSMFDGGGFYVEVIPSSLPTSTDFNIVKGAGFPDLSAILADISKNHKLVIL